MEVLQFSLWLVPSSKAGAPLSGWIAELANRFRGPLFAPHLTLLSGIASETLGLSVARALQNDGGKVSMIASAVAGSEAFFRNLYLRISPDDGIAKLHVQSAAAIHREGDAAFLPHVSLFYGLLTKGERQLAVAEVEARLPLEIEFDAVELWNVRGDVASWQRIARVGL